MKKKIDVDEDGAEIRLEKLKKKNQSDFMKQLTDLAQQVVERPPSQQPEPSIDETKPSVNIYLSFLNCLSSFFLYLKEIRAPPTSSQPSSRLARETPLRRPLAAKPVASSKPARIPVKPAPTAIPYTSTKTTTAAAGTTATESTQTTEIRAKTPREFSASFLRLIEKLKEFNWFEEQYPLIKFDVCCYILRLNFEFYSFSF